MVKNLVLGMLVAGTLPFILADATSSISAKVVSPSQVRQNHNLASSGSDTLQPCIPSKPKNSCLLTKSSDRSLKIHSEYWLENMASLLLTSSIFSNCKAQGRLKKYSINGNNVLYSGSLTNSGCIFPWQNPSEPEPNSLKLSDDVGNFGGSLFDLSSQNLSDELTVGFESSLASPEPIASPKAAQKFPRLSRTSLIVSLPIEDSTFAPLNSKLANPAPKAKRIASPFGWRRRPYSYQLQFHQGIDFGAPLGSPVVAIGDGIVTKVVSGCYDFGSLFCGGQLGNWIEIDHGNGKFGIYGHLKHNSIAIKEGAKVWKNQEIAEVGSSGWSTGAHLDFRLRVNGEYRDPAKYLTPPNLVVSQFN
ncbi:MAG: M23 family metallopeptidase [Cyanobacteria bacterium P01_G01_bin.19]